VGQCARKRALARAQFRAAQGLGRQLANVSQILTLDRALLTERVGRVSKKQL
jgi:hypothetical protein